MTWQPKDQKKGGTTTQAATPVSALTSTNTAPTWQSKDDDLPALHQLLEVDLLGLIGVIQQQQLGVRVQGQLAALLDGLGLLDCRAWDTAREEHM